MAEMSRLYRVSRAIRRYPQNSDQGNWHVSLDSETPVHADDGQHPECGTTLCFAGWTAFLYAPEGARLRMDTLVLADGSVLDIEAFAVDQLGITADQGLALFYTAQNADEIDAAIDALEANSDIDGFDLRTVVRDYRRAQNGEHVSTES